MTAQTMIVMNTPARMKNIPRLPICGRNRFMKRTMAQQSHVQMIKLTNMCHDWGTNPGCIRAYMETVCCPKIADIEAAPRIQARQFQKPAKKPHARPYFPAVMEAQWYTDLILAKPH